MKITAKGTRMWIVFVLMLLLSFGSVAFAAPGGESGDHGRQKDSDDQGTLLGLVFGDQWVIVRDVSADGDGRPVYFTWTWPPEAFNSDGDFDPQWDDLPLYDIEVAITNEPGCVQPVSFGEVSGLSTQFEVSQNGANFYNSYGREIVAYLIPLDPECKIPDAFEEEWGALVMEADAGRFNLSRSPQDVIDAAYEEALQTINQALSIGLDPPGRLLLELPVLDEYGFILETTFKPIDSPVENIGLYAKVMQEGCLPDTANVTLSESAISLLNDGGLSYLVCDNTPLTDEDLQRSASFLAGAGDKVGRITIDLLIYLNDRLELNTLVWSENKKEITNVIYYDFQDFSYDRCDEYAATTADLLQPVDNSGDYPETFNVVTGVTIFDKRFDYNWPEGVCLVGGNSYDTYADVDANTPIINFVRAADDALTIINYIHNYELPAYPLDPVPEM